MADNDDPARRLSLVGVQCTNVALNKSLTTTTQNKVKTWRLQTDGIVDRVNCLPDKAMDNPEIVIDFEDWTEVRFLHIFIKQRQLKCE